MIKGQELRIGNLVLFNSEIREVTHLHEEEVCVAIEPHRRNVNCEPPLAFQGIPLTDEWIEKFGFTDKTECSPRTPERGGVYLREQFYEEYIWFYCLSGDNWIRIKFVHQLQNLFYALTGEELTIKEAILQ